MTLSWLDADAVAAADYKIIIDCWPSGRLTLSQLGRRFGTFAQELARARDQARMAGMLAHGTAMPETFQGALVDGSTSRPARLMVFETHVTIVPENDDPIQVPLGAIAGVTTTNDPPSVTIAGASSSVVLGLLARQRDAFVLAVINVGEAQGLLLANLAGQLGFSDGAGVSRDKLNGFDDLLARFSAPDRLGGAREMIGRARGGEPRLGFVKLLDPDGEVSAAAVPLPEHWASFLLVPVGPLVAMEILAGPSAATYVFEGDIGEVNRDLQLLHFRRGPLALTAEQATITPDNPHRLALRRLEPLKRLRARTRARIVHNEGWSAALAAAIA